MTRAIMNVPYIPDYCFDEMADRLIDGFGRRFGPVTKPVVPVEDILESYLDWSLDFDDLVTGHNLPDALGAIFFKSRRVVIDASLDPSEYPWMKGRYHFTVAHEIGHICLHCELCDENSTHDRQDAEWILCREGRGTRKPQVEWQADRFASCLLMPADLTKAAWRKATGGDDPIVICDGDSLSRASICWFEMANRFGVSNDAMRIRLETMGLLLKSEVANAYAV